MIRGQVKWFDSRKGYGFIIGPTGRDVFVHYTQITSDGYRKLTDGQQVTYELVQAEKGLQAHNVTPVPEAVAATPQLARIPA